MTRISRDQWAMELALTTAKRTTCCRRGVGCVLLNSDGHVLATGYNGVAAGQAHCNEIGVRDTGRKFFGKSQEPVVIEKLGPEHFPNACPGAFSASGTNLDGCYAIHAEQNAMLQCKDVREIHTAYVTTSPCMTCCKLLLNTGCRRIVFLEEYPHTQAKDLWERAGRSWEQFQT